MILTTRQQLAKQIVVDFWLKKLEQGFILPESLKLDFQCEESETDKQFKERIIKLLNDTATPCFVEKECNQ